MGHPRVILTKPFKSHCCDTRNPNKNLSDLKYGLMYRHVRLVVDEICFPYISETIGLFDIFSLPTVKTIYGVFPIEGYI